MNRYSKIIFYSTFLTTCAVNCSFQGATPLARKRSKSLSPLEINTSPSFLDENSSFASSNNQAGSFDEQFLRQSTIATDLQLEIDKLIVDRQSPYTLGKKIFDFKKENPELGAILARNLHNKVSIPLRVFFTKDKKFDKEAYKDYLEKSLPRISDSSQETPPVTPTEVVHWSTFKRKRSAFEINSDSDKE